MASSKRANPGSTARTTPAPSASMPDAVAGYAVEEIDAVNGADWLKLFLRASTFLKLPAGNIQALVARLEEVPVKAGQIIIHQGGQANNYYIIKQGQCRVLRQIQGSEDPIELAVLQAGDGFGEDALITRGRRNASVIAVQDSVLMRLSRHNFTTLLVNPLISVIAHAEALQQQSQNAVLLDVRAPHEHRRDGLPGSVNVPLPLLRANLDRLDPTASYIAYCNSGNLSAAAAFMLAQRGLRSRIIAGGLRAQAAAKPATAAAAGTPQQTAAAKPKKARVSTAPAKAKPATPAPTPITAPVSAPAAALASPAIPAPDASIACIGRDDAQLWTPIPVPSGLNPDTLRILEHGAAAPSTGAPAPRNTTIRCLETADDLLAVTRDLSETTPYKPTPAPSAQVPTPAAPKAAQTDVPLGWISDQYVWDTVLGYRSDPTVSALMDLELSDDQAPATQAKSAAPPARSTAPQPVAPAATAQARPTRPSRKNHTPAANAVAPGHALVGGQIGPSKAKLGLLGLVLLAAGAAPFMGAQLGQRATEWIELGALQWQSASALLTGTSSRQTKPTGQGGVGTQHSSEPIAGKSARAAQPQGATAGKPVMAIRPTGRDSNVDEATKTPTRQIQAEREGAGRPAADANQVLEIF